ncbi:hypothetical protein GQ53DRAFT_851860 [Thozetella sp. PMI_491]|nr:hypothetical protein GQ53DRAFT_851860 [Thozetella sp. PMI_491]
MQMVLGETMSLRAIMDSFGTTGLTPGLFDIAGPVEACRNCLSGLENLLPPHFNTQGAIHQRKIIALAQLARPFKESKARKLLVYSRRHLIIKLSCFWQLAVKWRERPISYRRWTSTQTLSDAQCLEIAQWLECTNPSPLQNSALGKHEYHTSAWLLRSPEWLTWLTQAGPSRLLWISGIPGPGKTVLASYLIEHLKRMCNDTAEIGTVYYYCHYPHAQNEAAPFLRWNIGQLCRQAKWMPDTVQMLHRQECDPSDLSCRMPCRQLHQGSRRCIS